MNPFFGRRIVWGLAVLLGAAGITTSAVTPSVLWQKTYGGSSSDELRAIEPASGGGFLLAGNSLSTNSGTKTSARFGSTDFWIVRIDEQGQALWDRSFGGTDTEELTAARRTADGGFVLVGWSASQNNGNKSSANFGGPDAWLVRLDADGNKLWDRAFGGNDVDRFNDVWLLSDGGFLLCGYSRSQPSGNKSSANYGVNDGWLARVSASGELVWEKSFGGVNGDSFRRIRAMQDGTFIAGGTSYSPPSENGRDSNWGGGDYWYVRIDADGNRLGQGSIGGIQDDTLSDFQVLPDGGLILVGESWSPMASLKSTPNFSVPGSFYGADVWLVRLDSAWNKSWDRSFGGAVADVASRIELLPDGGLLLAGYTDAAGGGNKTSPRYGREDFWLVRLETDGSKVWEFSLGSSKTDELFALYCTQDGGFLLGGQSWDATDQTKTAPAFGETDFYLARIPSDLPRLRRVPQSGEDIRQNGFRMTLVGESNRLYRTEFSTNLADWYPLTTNHLAGTEVEILDHTATNAAVRFYRSGMQID
jgi:hypothetical protein